MATNQKYIPALKFHWLTKIYDWLIGTFMPEKAFKENIQGRVNIFFVIDEKGTITNVKALDNKRATIAMQKAAEKAVKRIPKLIPATHGEKPVRIKYSIPVGFRMK